MKTQTLTLMMTKSTPNYGRDDAHGDVNDVDDNGDDDGDDGYGYGYGDDIDDNLA